MGVLRRLQGGHRLQVIGFLRLERSFFGFYC